MILREERRAGARPGQYNLAYSEGVASVVKTIDVLDAPPYATYVNTAFINAFGPQTQYPYGGRPGSITPDSIREVMGAGVNWQDAIFRNAPVRDATLGFTGGDEKGGYAISTNLLQQGGVITGSQFRRGGLRINFDRAVSDPIRISSNLAVTRSLNDMVRSSTINGYNAIGIVRQAVTYVPMTRVDSARLTTDPRAEDASTFSQFGANPLRYTDEVSESDQVTRGIGGLRGVARLGSGFSLDLSMATNYERRTYGVYFPRTGNEGRNASGDAVSSGSEFQNIILDGAINVPRAIIASSFDPKTNPAGRYPMIRQDRKADARFSDLYVEDGSYVRLKNVQLGYNLALPGARTAHVYVNGVNLKTWTTYSGFDPEVSAFGSPDRPGVDQGSYPLSRIISFGVNTTF